MAYAKQFPRPVIVVEDLTGIRDNFDKSKELNRRFHSLPFRKLQEIIKYKALLGGIDVSYLPKKEVNNTSKIYHRCGHVAWANGKGVHMLKCGLVYNRDLNACINIVHALTRSCAMGSLAFEPADKGGVKPSLNAGSLAFKGR